MRVPDPIARGGFTPLLSGAELLEKWKQVVDEATAMHKLKSILAYRRKAADKRERAKKESGDGVLASHLVMFQPDARGDAGTHRLASQICGRLDEYSRRGSFLTKGSS